MSKIKYVFDKLNEENINDENEENQDLICFVCNNIIRDGQVYITDEELKVYCSEKCYLEELNSKYY